MLLALVVLLLVLCCACVDGGIVVVVVLFSPLFQFLFLSTIELIQLRLANNSFQPPPAR